MKATNIYDPNTVELEALLEASEYKLSEAKHRVHEVKLDKDTVEDLGRKCRGS